MMTETKDQPVAWFSTLPDGKLSIKIVGKPTKGNWEPLYTTPPQRKPLTDEEIEKMRHLIDWTAHWSYNTFARAIEAAHGIKDNT
jgi:hypothetical protein